MEPNAPNHVIGTGSLQIEPQMQTVHAEMEKIDKALDGLKEKAATVFDGLVSKLEQANTILDRLAERADAIRTPQTDEAERAEPQEERRERRRIPEPESPEAQRMLGDAVTQDQWRDVVEAVQSINQKMDQIVIRTIEGGQ